LSEIEAIFLMSIVIFIFSLFNIMKGKNGVKRNTVLIVRSEQQRLMDLMSH